MNTIMAGIISLFLVQTPLVSPLPAKVVLGDVNYSLENRYTNTYVNDIFADNILLTLAYMRGTVTKGEKVNWESVRAPFTYELILKPGEVFAFHDRVLPGYKDKVVTTTNAHFHSSEGFLSDGWLVGDGVCHLASFMNVVAREAGLEVEAPTRHDFAKIEDVSKEQGVSIYYDPNGVGGSAKQNLYITNNRDKNIAFVFDYQNDALAIAIEEI
jgi:hypothetical protein